ncbi:MAG: 2-oxo acid dehydrogenase subunit E2 [Nevskiaceae bacterium]|nr:MAG: 2-oxo acid dehydrogenase subunit E2 [Nevskiaceae bacterium]
MAIFEFKLPDIGEGIAESEIATWRVALGETIKEDQPLVDMLTDKAAVEIPSPVAGVVKELRGQAGDKIAVGAVLLVIDTAGEAAAGKSEQIPAAVTAPAPAPVTAKAAQAASAQTIAPVREGKPLAAPSVRKRARELGVDLALVPGSKRGGRVGHEDLENYCQAPAAVAAPASVATPAKATGVEQIRVIGLRRKIAEAMQRSKQRIPHFAYVEEVDVTELEALRVHLNANKLSEQTKLTLLPFLMQALVKAVPAFPMVNATYDDEAGIVSRYQALHVGIATQTPNGLVVPVAKHAETLDIWRAAAEIKRLADAARNGKATREELSGSSITITSLGPMGGIVSTPVINAPEVAIIGVNKMVERPMVRNGQVVVRTMMNLSSSFDHRIVDGWDAASFIQKLKGLLEHPATLFMP